MENPTEIELCPTEPPSQQTRLSDVKSKKKKKVTDVLKLTSIW